MSFIAKFLNDIQWYVASDFLKLREKLFNYVFFINLKLVLILNFHKKCYVFHFKRIPTNSNESHVWQMRP